MIVHLLCCLKILIVVRQTKIVIWKYDSEPYRPTPNSTALSCEIYTVPYSRVCIKSKNVELGQNNFRKNFLKWEFV